MKNIWTDYLNSSIVLGLISSMLIYISLANVGIIWALLFIFGELLALIGIARAFLALLEKKWFSLVAITLNLFPFFYAAFRIGSMMT